MCDSIQIFARRSVPCSFMETPLLIWQRALLYLSAICSICCEIKALDCSNRHHAPFDSLFGFLSKLMMRFCIESICQCMSLQSELNCNPRRALSILLHLHGVWLLSDVIFLIFTCWNRINTCRPSQRFVFGYESVAVVYGTSFPMPVYLFRQVQEVIVARFSCGNRYNRRSDIEANSRWLFLGYQPANGFTMKHSALNALFSSGSSES